MVTNGSQHFVRAAVQPFFQAMTLVALRRIGFARTAFGALHFQFGHEQVLPEKCESQMVLAGRRGRHGRFIAGVLLPHGQFMSLLPPCCFGQFGTETIAPPRDILFFGLLSAVGVEAEFQTARRQIEKPFRQPQVRDVSANLVKGQVVRHFVLQLACSAQQGGCPQESWLQINVVLGDGVVKEMTFRQSLRLCEPSQTNVSGVGPHPGHAGRLAGMQLGGQGSTVFDQLKVLV